MTKRTAVTIEICLVKYRVNSLIDKSSVTIFVGYNKRVMTLSSVRWPVRAGNCLLCNEVQRRL